MKLFHITWKLLKSEQHTQLFQLTEDKEEVRADSFEQQGVVEVEGFPLAHLSDLPLHPQRRGQVSYIYVIYRFMIYHHSRQACELFALISCNKPESSIIKVDSVDKKRRKVRQ